MKKHFASFSVFAPWAVALLLAKSIGVGVMFFLPAASLEKPTAPDEMMTFANYRIDQAFGFRGGATPQAPQPPVKKAPTYDLKDLVLHAIYKQGTGGFAVVVDAKSKESAVLAPNERYKGYTLEEIHTRHVVFSKEGKRYSLYLDEAFEVQPQVMPTTSETTQSRENVTVSRQEVLRYAKDFDAIWKNIAIIERVENGQITGFLVEYVRHNSTFGKLGLKRGDVITKVNGEALTSYSQAFRIYENIQSYNYVVITVERDGKERELEYEVL